MAELRSADRGEDAQFVEPTPVRRTIVERRELASGEPVEPIEPVNPPNLCEPIEPPEPREP